MAHHLGQKIANVLVFLLFLSNTVYNLVGPLPTDDVIQHGQTYFTPSYWIAYVWTIINFLLGGFVIYQWFEPAHEPAIHGVGWHFVISVLLSSGWLHLLKHGYFIIGFFVSLITASSVSFVFYRLARDYPPEDWHDKLFVHAPFSLWHGWIVFSSTVNLFLAFTELHDNGPSVWQRILVLLGLIFLTTSAVSYVEYKKEKGDITGALVLGLGLLAIFTNQQDPWIHWPALILAIFTLLYPLRIFFVKSHEENAPLLG